MTISCILLGGGGHARVLIDCIQASGKANILGILDIDEKLWGETMMDIPILGGNDLISQIIGQGVEYFAVSHGSIGDARPRQRSFELGLANGLKPLTVIHPSAVISKWATVNAGAQIFAGATVNPFAVIGHNAIINTGAVVEHDCVIGDHAHLATGSKLSGTVRVGTRAHIGAGAVIRQGLSIGDDAVVGVGAVVVKDIPQGIVVIGNPARPMKSRESG